MPKELRFSLLKKPGDVLQAYVTSVDVPPDKLLRNAYEYESRFRAELDQAGPFQRLDMIVNSPGGSIASASGMTAAVAEAVKRYGAKIRVLISGECSSAATLLIYELPFKALPVYITPGSHIMIHMPKTERWTKSGGSWSLLAKAAKAATVSTMISVYRARTRRTRQEIRGIMESGKTFSPGEAVAYGLCDEVLSMNDFLKGE